MIHPLFDIDCKLAVVTGSSKGLGFALARGLLQAGATVVLNGRAPAALAAAVTALTAQDPSWAGRAHPVPFDVTDEVAVTEAMLPPVLLRRSPAIMMVPLGWNVQRHPGGDGEGRAAASRRDRLREDHGAVQQLPDTGRQ